MFGALAAILYVIAVAMVGFGGWTAIDGSQWFPAERAVAQYISGVGFAAGGFVLFGIATVVLCLGRLNQTLSKAQGKIPAGTMIAPVEAASLAIPAFATAAVAAGAATVAGNTPAAEDAWPGPAYSHTDIDMAEPRADASFLNTSAPQDTPLSNAYPTNDFSRDLRLEDEAPVKIRESAFGYSYAPAAEAPSSLTSGYYAKPESDGHGDADMGVLADEPSYERPVIVDVSADAREEDITVAEITSVEDEQKPTVVGSYESGGNRYVMYSDGAIEAHLPGGVRMFRSLDELKQFVSSPSAA